MADVTTASADLPPAYPPPERPAPPRPQRLDRNRLTIAAVMLGTLVLAAVVFVQPSQPLKDSAPPSPQLPQGTFLDQPTQSAIPAVGEPGTQPAYGQSGQISGPGTDPSTGAVAVTPSVDPYAAQYTGAYSTPAPPPVPDRRTLAYQAALEAPVTSSAALSTTGISGDVSSTTNSVAAVTPSIAVGPHQQFLADAARPRPTVIHTSVAPAPGPYALQAGTLIPGVLITEINSDLPGEVLAQVARDVFDSQSQRVVLIPKGSRLLGTYEDQVAVGQNRLVVAWTRVIFPDGRSITLPGLQTKDRAGAGGVADQVDNHGGKVIGTAALLSLISAGAQLSQPNGSYGFGAYPSAGQVAAGAAGQQLSEVTAQLLRRNMDVRPTIRIRQGMPFNVFLSTDLTFPGPYSTTAQH